MEMKKVLLCLVLVGLVGWVAPAEAEICTIDDVPAATLLVPYFEVDLADRGGVTTLFSINNASATAVLAHVTVWTDESIPTLDFDIYLTGYDVQTINLRDIFEFGNLPITASAGQDPGDVISNQGAISQDINFASCNSTLPYPPGVIGAARLATLRAAHTGQFAPLFGGCLAADYGDDVARGYVTVDTVTQCNLLFPSSPGYFSTGIASNQNVLWGDYFYVDPAENFAQGETLVHIESCPNPSVGSGADDCPFLPGEYTFYGRYAAVAGQDQREPLATTFATRYILGGVFDAGTDLIVWRDSKTIPTGANGVHSCAVNPSWFPLSQTEVTGFDEAENPEDLCFVGDVISPVLGGVETCFPLEAQRVSVADGSAIAAAMAPTADFGWLFLDLNHSISADPFPGVAQAWVTTVMSAEGRFSVGFDAIQLDSVCTVAIGG
jgi:hypothetical protein